MPLTITACNTGVTEWSAASGYALTAVADSCGNSSGAQITIIPGITVSPGASHAFSATFSGFDTLGPCNLQFQMTHNGVPFGEILSVSPEVIAAVNDADLVGHTFPATMAPGQELWVGVTMRNTGNMTWIPDTNHSLGVFGSDDCSLFEQTRFTQSEAILPNRTHQFMVRVTAPVGVGPCNFTLQMVEEFVEWFGDPLSFTINVAEPANATTDWEIYQ